MHGNTRVQILNDPPIQSRDHPPGCFLVEIFHGRSQKWHNLDQRVLRSKHSISTGQGLHFKENGKKEDALKYLKMAVCVAPHFCDAHNAMGNCLDEMGRYDEAIKKYEKVLELNPEHTEAQFKRAMIEKKIRYYEEAPF